MMLNKPRIMMLSTSIGMGGADQQILNLARSLMTKGYAVQIIAMTPLGTMGLEAQAQGMAIASLNMSRGIPNPVAMMKMLKWLEQWQPDLLHSHMFHANLLARIIRLIKPIPVLVATAHNIKEGKRWRELAYTWTDSLCDLTTQVSRAGVERYIKIGAVPSSKMKFTPNSVDEKRFFPDPSARKLLRQELQLDHQFVWLAVGRNHPQKDYVNMLKAFAKVCQNASDTILLIVGEGLINSDLTQLAQKLDIISQIKFLGVRRDVPALMNAADGYVMSSAWEGTPLVLLEASATGLPLVVTDVGGNRDVVLDQESGFIVPPHDSQALAQGMLRLMSLSMVQRQKMGQQGRSHIQANYCIQAISVMWEEIYQSLLVKN
jgi:glycosyltransferase involved in cell wall biosynthesis